MPQVATPASPPMTAPVSMLLSVASAMRAPVAAPATPRDVVDRLNRAVNQMLAADPTTGEVRRFLTGPVGCEITGNGQTPDGKTLFVNIQHPGELPLDHPPRSDPQNPKAQSDWPDGQSGGRPRSATLAIRREDGAPIGT